VTSESALSDLSARLLSAVLSPPICRILIVSNIDLNATFTSHTVVVAAS
jgi:hypothetical protein